MPQFITESLGPLHQKLSVTVSTQEYMPKVEQGLKKASKSIAIKGFRPGMVPMPVVKKMYGHDVMAEEITKLANAELEKYINDNNIKFLGDPLPMRVADQKIDVENPTDYRFEFELGIQPAFEVPVLNGAAGLIQYEIKIDDALLAKELEYEQTRNGKSEEVEEIQADDVLMLDVKSVEEGKFQKSINLLLSVVKNEGSKKELLALTKDATINFDFKKAYDGDIEMVLHKILNISHEEADLLDLSAMNITLQKIFRLKKAELNEELFEKIYPGKEITTLDAFKEELKKDLEKVYANETMKKANADLMAKVVSSTPMEFPVDFLKRWIQSRQKEVLTMEQLNEGFEGFVEDLKWTLIKTKVITDNNLRLQEADLQTKTIEYLKSVYGTMDESFLISMAQRILSNEKERDYMAEQMVNERVFNHLRSTATFTNKSVTMEEFEHIITHHHHNHHH